MRLNKFASDYEERQRSRCFQTRGMRCKGDFGGWHYSTSGSNLWWVRNRRNESVPPSSTHCSKFVPNEQPIRNLFVELHKIRRKHKVYNGWVHRCRPDIWLNFPWKFELCSLRHWLSIARNTQYAIRSTQYEQRTPSHGDFFEIYWTFCVLVRIILNIFVYRM